MLLRAVILLMLFLNNYDSIGAARILGLFGVPAPSHHIMFKALLKALAERGHTVEVASPYRTSGPLPENYTDIIIPIPDVDRREVLNLLVNVNYSPVKEHIGIWLATPLLCETHLSSPELQRFLSQDPSSPKYDLIFVEIFFYDCLTAFSHHLKAPFIGMVSQYSIPWATDLVGNPSMYSFIRHYSVPYGQKMNFMERFYNTVFNVGMKLIRRFYFMVKQNEVAMKYFGNEMPPLWEIERNVSLIFHNAHPAVTPFYPSMPNLVDVAGMHILANPPPLPQDLSSILENNEKVVLFSLGSIIESSFIEEERLIVILKALREIPYKVVWRWDGDIDNLPIPLPSNVYASKWLPQQSLLAHFNLACFVTHGGLLSLQETTYHGVPVVGFPFYGDQAMNMKHATESGIGFSLNFFTFTKDELVSSINEVIKNPRYKQNAVKMSKIFRDQLETSLERGVYWTEYVLRHNGAPHLRSAAMDLWWFQYYLIDVIAFAFILVFTIVFMLYIFVKFLCKFICKKSHKSKKD